MVHIDWVREAMGVRDTDWILYVSADEFHEYPRGDVIAMLREADLHGVLHISGR